MLKHTMRLYYLALLTAMAGAGDSTPGGTSDVILMEGGTFGILMEGGVSHILLQGS